jgi:hypothetical protein
MLDEEIPSHRFILARHSVQSRHVVLGGIGLVVTSLEQEDFVASNGESGRAVNTKSVVFSHPVRIPVLTGERPQDQNRRQHIRSPRE